MTERLQTARDRITRVVAAHSDSTGPTICIGWSGGRDSTVLLDLTDRLRHELEFDLAAIHIDHGLRETAERDARFCRRTAHRRGIPLRVEAVDVRSDTSLEAQARHQRYAAFVDAAEALDATHLATAHHANDAIESALLNWTRGTGARGLGSMLREHGDIPGNPNAQIDLLRPLLHNSRDEIAAYADARELTWVDDPTNTERASTRNRLRQDVVPKLTAEAGSTEPLVRTLQNLAEDADALERRAADLLDRPVPGESRTCRSFSTPRLADAPNAETTAALRRAARTLPGPIGWRRPLLERALELLQRSDETSHQIAIPGGLLVIEPDRTLLHATTSRGGEEVENRDAAPLQLQVPRADAATEWHALPWFEHTIRWRVFEPEPERQFPTDDTVAWFDADDLPDSLLVRSPRPGERLDAFGMAGSKSLTDLLRGADIPRRKRWRWPLIALPDGETPHACLWLAGLRRSITAPVDSETQSILEIELQSLE